jgi:hypothetical protein
VAVLENGHIKADDLPISAMEYKGLWNPSTNTPNIGDNVMVASGFSTAVDGDYVFNGTSAWIKAANGYVMFFDNDPEADRWTIESAQEVLATGTGSSPSNGGTPWRATWTSAAQGVNNGTVGHRGQ